MAIGGPFDAQGFATDNLRAKATERYSFRYTNMRSWLATRADPLGQRFSDEWYADYQRERRAALAARGMPVDEI